MRQFSSFPGLLSISVKGVDFCQCFLYINGEFFFPAFCEHGVWYWLIPLYFLSQKRSWEMEAMLIFPLILLIMFSQLTWNIERYSSERFFCLLEGTLTSGFYLLSYKISKICSVTVSEHIKRFLWLPSLIRQRDLVFDVLFKKLKSKLDWSCLELHCKESKNSLQVLPKAQRAELESS